MTFRFPAVSSLLVALLALLVVAWSGPIRAQESADAAPVVWVGLIKGDDKTPTSPALTRLSAGLNKVFGYPNYHLLHESRVPLDKTWEQWVLPSKEFYMKLQPLGRQADGVEKIHFELYHDKDPLIQAEYHMAPGRPLFIRGPYYQSGELIFVLRLVSPPSE